MLDEKVAEITGTDEPKVPSPNYPKTDLLKCFAIDNRGGIGNACTGIRRMLDTVM